MLTYDLRNFGLSGAANGGAVASGLFEARDVLGSPRHVRGRRDTAAMGVALFSRRLGANSTFAAVRSPGPERAAHPLPRPRIARPDRRLGHRGTTCRRATFRAEPARRGGHSPRATALVGELADASPEFRRFWQLNTVGHLGDREKTFPLRDGTPATMRYEPLGPDANRGLGPVVCTPVPGED